ncbi:hypothetical protein MK079_03115 [Candidatus Gracilibacteria bacterium]|nr:hypothetical protein [Candidatus Gracilibacteria bacterium]
MQTIDVYQATHNSDTTEGRGHTVIIGNFTHKSDAELAAAGKCVMGTDGKVQEAVIQIFDSIEEYQDLTGDFPRETLQKIKSAALAKLTPRERKVLGIKE